MEKTYQPKKIEAKWSTLWEDAHYGKPSGTGEPYCIMIPPPNVTGSLHMGHGFQYTLMDILIRFHRLRGYNTLWQVGTDHAGIATQMLVERNLALKGIDRKDIGREAFLEKAWEWKNQSGNAITTQMRRLGILVDWERECFTMDEKLSDAVTEAFCQLYNEGLIYKGQRLVNWDTQLKTAVSDLEINTQEVQGKMYSIKYVIDGTNDSIRVATTRPETLFGDSAVAVHPEDERFKHLLGKMVILPISNRKIPIIADTYVDPEFGSGCVKITPAHDFNDYEVGKRHQLEMINIMNNDGTLNHLVPEQYQNLTVKEARQLLIEELESNDLLLNVDSHTIQAPIGDRSGTVLEPRLTSQWFVSTEQLAKKALASGKNGDIKFHPDNWINTYNHWLENITDWCISRQLWWGHRIPAWYDPAGNIYCGHSEKAVREKHQIDPETPLEQDTDVLDTWFSSALWPFSTLGWPEKTEALKTFYPTSVIVTGFDIIFFWIARMIMMGEKFINDVPFKDIYITGLIRDFRGEKMSKSKGNVINPIDVIDGISLVDLLDSRTKNLMQPDLKNKITQLTKKEFPEGIPGFGTDALRFTFCALANTGRDIKFDISRLEGYRNFCNKIWNGARFIQMLKQDITAANHKIRIPATQWIQSRLAHLSQECDEAIQSYRFDVFAKSLYHGFWHDFCDWYLELIKVSFESGTDEEKQQIIFDLEMTLSQYLFHLHPVIPFITEEIFSSIHPAQQSILDMTYPASEAIDTATTQSVDQLCEWISQIRMIRSELSIPPSVWLEVKGLDTLSHPLKSHLVHLTRLKDYTSHDQEKLIQTQLGNHPLMINIANSIDVGKEVSRLEKQLAKQVAEKTKLSDKLSNPNYSKKAPDQLIERDKKRISDLDELINKNRFYIESLS